MSLLGQQFRSITLLVSTGRTGTKAMAHYFDTIYEDIRGLHEPFPSRGLRCASNRYLCGRLKRSDLAQILFQSRRKLFGSITESIYVEANPFLHGCLDVFDELFGQPRVIHVVRDPRAYIRSYLNFGAFRGIKRIAADWYPYWMLKPDFYEKPPKKRWKSMNELERIAWRWCAINEELNRGEELFGGRYLRIRFEDLFSTDPKHVRKLCDLLEVPYKRELQEMILTKKVNASRRKDVSRWQNWKQDVLASVSDQCRHLMHLYGYEVETNADY